MSGIATGKKRLRVGVVFGGRSGEHAVSLMSARSVIQALDPEKYEVVPFGITPDGAWLAGDALLPMLERGHMSADDGHPVIFPPDPTAPGVYSPATGETQPWPDVMFPVMHGTYGEDGCIQGLFEMAGVPYVGCSVAASALGMDKGLMKSTFAHVALPQVPFFAVSRRAFQRDFDSLADRVEAELGYPCFVKPANLGSSVGISKATDRQQLFEACALAARFDRKLVIEAAALDCREIEVSVLGNDEPIASVPGEIIPANEFYDYRAKYQDDRSQLLIPAPLSESVAERVRRMAIDAFRALGCEGLARVDFFVKRDESAIFINEINTMPGFTPFSMYPKLWAATGLPYEELLDRLIELAFERHGEYAATERLYQPGD